MWGVFSAVVIESIAPFSSWGRWASRRRPEPCQSLYYGPHSVSNEGAPSKGGPHRTAGGLVGYVLRRLVCPYAHEVEVGPARRGGAGEIRLIARRVHGRHAQPDAGRGREDRRGDQHQALVVAEVLVVRAVAR